MAAVRLVVDWPACKAHGVCAELLPEIVELDEWGYPVIAAGAVPSSLRRYARRAVSSCPTLALRLLPATDQDEGEEGPRSRQPDGRTATGDAVSGAAATGRRARRSS